MSLPSVDAVPPSALVQTASTILLSDTADLLADTNLVFVLLGAIPLVAIGAFTLVSGEEKKTLAIRNDPANACRLGYTVDEVSKMEELTRLRYEADLKAFNEAVVEAEALGTQKPNGSTWLAEKAVRNQGSYFDGSGSNERPTMI